MRVDDCAIISMLRLFNLSMGVRTTTLKCEYNQNCNENRVRSETKYNQNVKNKKDSPKQNQDLTKALYITANRTDINIKRKAN